jgi:ATP synthase protein I
MFDSNDEIQEIRALSKDEAEVVKAANPMLNPWRVVIWQVVVTLLIGLLGLVLSQQKNTLYSMLWGGLCVVIPSGLFARGMTRGRDFESLRLGLSNFLVWELLKIALSIAMLVMASVVVSDLSWSALVASFIVVTKVYWLAGFWILRRTTS